MLHEGNVVRASSAADSPLVVINQIQPTYVSFTIPQPQLPAVQRYMGGGKLEVRAMPAGEPQPQRGVVTFIDNAVDQTTGTIRLKAVFANEERRLWPGQFVNVELTLTTEPNAIVVPSAALQSGQQGQYVFVVKEDSTVEVRRPGRPGESPARAQPGRSSPTTKSGELPPQATKSGGNAGR